MVSFSPWLISKEATIHQIISRPHQIKTQEQAHTSNQIIPNIKKNVKCKLRSSADPTKDHHALLVEPNSIIIAQQAMIFNKLV
jgi:hypothetical protein